MRIQHMAREKIGKGRKGGRMYQRKSNNDPGNSIPHLGDQQ
jgi:hypothetical protein